jgi:hypothetical protein
MTLRTFRRLAVVGGLALLAPVAADAQEHKGCACCAQSGHACHGAAAKTPPASPAPLADAAAAPAPPYKLEYEGLFAGVITSVMRHQGMDVELTIAAGENSFEVLVAPMTWLDAKQASFRTGERVEIVGARWDRGTSEAIVAREIRTAAQTVVVRDSEGRPLWN